MAQKVLDLLAGGTDFPVEFVCRHALGTVTQNDSLFQTVRGRNLDAVRAGQVVGRFLDVHVGGLGGLGVDHVDAVHLLDRTGIVLDAVGVKDQNEVTFFDALIVAQQVNERRAGGIQIVVGEGFELIPCKDDVVAVNEQVVVGFDA